MQSWKIGLCDGTDASLRLGTACSYVVFVSLQTCGKYNNASVLAEANTKCSEL